MSDGLISPTFLIVAGLFSLFLVWSNVRANKKLFVDVPLVGRSGIIGAFNFMRDGRGIMQKGYDQYRNSAFKIRQTDKYVVYVSGRTMVEEVRKAPDDVLSFKAGAELTLQAKYTLGKTVVSNDYHLPVLRTQLTRNLGVIFPEIDEEMKASFYDNIGAKLNGEEWSKFTAYETNMAVIARITNRAFLGLPVCRNPDYLSVSIKIALSVMTSSELLKRIPEFMRPFASKWLNSVPTNVQVARKYVGPIIAERRRMLEEYGDEWRKPNDMLSWLMDEAEGDEQNELLLVTRLLMLNFAALHTSSMTFTHVLFHLAAKPEYAEPMRAEVERVIAEEGWSKASVGMMHKLDSFVREALRVDGTGSAGLTRLALKPFTFSNGLHIPKGAWVSTPLAAIHGDEENYEDPLIFKPFRHVSAGDTSEDGSKEKIRPYAVSTAPDYLSFGHGQHACPGRFFAVTELKMMLAHILLNYDVKLENEGVRPPNIYFADLVMPNTNAEVMFRKRQTGR